MRRIDYWHVKFPYLGSSEITVKFHEDGYKVRRKTVRRLMQLMPIYAIYPKANLSKRNFKESVVPYLLRNYAVIIDWYSRKIVGHYLSDTLDTESVIYTVKEAITMHGIPVILDFDQGCQFTSAEHKALLKDLQCCVHFFIDIYNCQRELNFYGWV